MRIYKTFYGFLWRYKWRFVAFWVLIVVWGVAGSVQPYFYKLFVDAVPQGSYEALVKILVMYFGVRALRLISDLAVFFVGDMVLFSAARDARTAVLKKIQDLDFAFHMSKSTGSLISAMKRGDSAFFNMFHSININLAQVIVNLVVVMVFLGALRWEIAVMMGLSFVVNLVAAKYLIAYNIKKRAEFNEAEDEISAIIVDNLINFETVKLFAREAWEMRRLKTTFRGWMRRLWGYANSFRLIDIVVGTASNVGLFMILLYSLKQAVNLEFTTGEFVLILGFVSTFYPRFFDLIFRLRDTAKHYADLEKYFRILDNQVLIEDPVKPVKKKQVAGEIEFKSVGFSYPEGKKNALKNFNLHVRQGQSVALVGSSGAGKTTVVKLLLRFYDVDKGEVLVDGVNIKEFTKSSLRSFMGVVPQEPVLFNNTIGFNIGYGMGNPVKREIKAAAKMANLDGFINSLPVKYETQVGERGVKLSGGQKQRLAIARMILTDPEVIIFDEATSQLDSESERLIQEAFWKAARNKTTIIIAHRLSTVVKADKIVVIENGRVVEEGSHRALVNKKGGWYRKYWRLQVGG
jgi:ABC-type multidrug transport system fused ATPase/permease subunit